MQMDAEEQSAQSKRSAALVHSSMQLRDRVAAERLRGFGEEISRYVRERAEREQARNMAIRRATQACSPCGRRPPAMRPPCARLVAAM